MTITPTATQDMVTCNTNPEKPLEFLVCYTVQTPPLCPHCIQTIFGALPEVFVSFDSRDMVHDRAPVHPVRCARDEIPAANTLYTKNLKFFGCNTSSIF